MIYWWKYNYLYLDYTKVVAAGLYPVLHSRFDCQLLLFDDIDIDSLHSSFVDMPGNAGRCPFRFERGNIHRQHSIVALHMRCRTDWASLDLSDIAVHNLVAHVVEVNCGSLPPYWDPCEPLVPFHAFVGPVLVCTLPV